MSAVQYQRQPGLSRYETAFQILHKLRAGMVRPDQDRIGGIAGEHVEADETWIGGKTRGKGRGVHDKVLVACAVEVKQRKLESSLNKRRTGRYAGRVRACEFFNTIILMCGSFQLSLQQNRNTRSPNSFVIAYFMGK
jgi:hypothetical protein